MPMKLLSWGANTYGQLGLGLKSEQCLLPMEVLSEGTDLDVRDVISVVGGGGHSLIMDAKGALFSCGWNAKGQLGRSTEEEDCKDSKLALVAMDEEDHAVQIACGWDSSYCVTWGNTLLVWGSNAYGQLGIPKKEYPSVGKPMKIPNLNNLQSVSAGLRHVLVLTRDGRVMACGCGSKGQLGILDESREPVKELEEFREVPDLSNIVQVACGQNYSAALDNKGQIWVWGDNHHGQLGLDPSTDPSVHIPKCLPSFSVYDPTLATHEVARLYCGWTHMAARTCSSSVIVWGRNNYGQLGCHESMRPEPWKPQLIDQLEDACRMAVGAEHNLAMTEAGTVFSWGWNEHGNCGIGNDKNVLSPSQVKIAPPRKVILIGAGSGHSFALVED